MIGGLGYAAANWQLVEWDVPQPIGECWNVCDWWIGMCRSQSANAGMFVIGGLGYAAANRRLMKIHDP